MAKKLNDMLGGLDQPVILGSKAKKFFGKGPVRILIIQEDQSANEYFMAWPSSYIFTIKDRAYFLVPKCILRMKFPTLTYSYNNPFPYFLEFQRSTTTSNDLWKGKTENLPDRIKTLLSEIIIDSEIVQLGFNNRFMRALYSGGGLTLRQWFMIIGAVLVAILVLLQLSGRVDVIGNLLNSVGSLT